MSDQANNSIVLNKRSYAKVNEETGEESTVAYLTLNHPNNASDKVTFLRFLVDPKDKTQGRISADDMIAKLKARPNWRKSLQYAKHAEHGEYYFLGTQEETVETVDC